MLRGPQLLCVPPFYGCSASAARAEALLDSLSLSGALVSSQATEKRRWPLNCSQTLVSTSERASERTSHRPSDRANERGGGVGTQSPRYPHSHYQLCNDASRRNHLTTTSSCRTPCPTALPRSNALLTLSSFADGVHAARAARGSSRRSRGGRRPVRADVGVARYAPAPAVVERREDRDLYPLLRVQRSVASTSQVSNLPCQCSSNQLKRPAPQLSRGVVRVRLADGPRPGCRCLHAAERGAFIRVR
jgi:hypothetical protein